ncbi:helix-turn-helix domain-containing protein [Streptomyces sp. NPDC005774]|uniref:helix-turn-helix domain-containing protein n=1 Tax=Streptomyces sp. NPDC005774 TaxID=3364728 RepID=UPI00369678B0
MASRLTDHLRLRGLDLRGGRLQARVATRPRTTVENCSRASAPRGCCRAGRRRGRGSGARGPRTGPRGGRRLTGDRLTRPRAGRSDGPGGGSSLQAVQSCVEERRGVTGLRREEVALLAGISSEYYTRLERGNATGVSQSVIDGIAQTLQLDEAERIHLLDSCAAPTRPARHAAARPSTGYGPRPSASSTR